MNADSNSDGNAIRHDERLEHLIRGYNACQDCIKFIDAKSNILIGLSTVVAGFAITLAKWIFELPEGQFASLTEVGTRHPAAIWWVAVFFALGLIAFPVVIGACVWSVIARPASPGALTLLFPTPRSGIADLRPAIRAAIANLSRQAVLDEFEDQLFNLGKIVSRKLHSNRTASIVILAQLGFLVVAIALYCLLAIP